MENQFLVFSYFSGPFGNSEKFKGIQPQSHAIQKGGGSERLAYGCLEREENGFKKAAKMADVILKRSLGGFFEFQKF